ncbi:thioesterase family protein [Sulfobacillus sp. hq2]|uniref:acyl-CoA thioesterase n=1 Tax=Sulfobacillus TaxID=28033 RepID=UPI001FA8273F|nr:thioesterase family protein [Sulfobacillus sp. hq2]
MIEDRMEQDDEPTPGQDIWRTKVAWGDTDAAGFVFYPNYFAWFDEATHHFIGSLAQSSPQWFTVERIGFPLLEASIQFFAPLHFGDPIEVSTTVEHVGNKSMTLLHDIVCRGQRIAHGREKRAWVTFKDVETPVAIPIPETVRPELLRRLVSQQSS